MPKTIRIATRGSALALAQSHWVADRLAQAHPDLVVELFPIKTEGDLRLDDLLHEIGGKGVFTREIDRALLEDRADLAVHSLKDLPTENTPGLTLGAVPVRVSDDDVLAGCAASSLEAIPAGAVVATGSLRRRAQLLRLRPDLRIEPIRGNVDTRLEKTAAEGWAGVVLAEAGLTRLAREDVPRLPLPQMLPAPGQGALGIVIREEDAALAEWIAPLHDIPSAQRVTAERAFLSTLDAGCHAPVGARTIFMDDGRLRMAGAVFSRDGRNVCGGEMAGDPAEADALGARLAQSLLADGADRLLQEMESHE